MNGGGLKISLEMASWTAVDDARELGASAIPTIEPFSKDEDFRKRQVAMAAAGATGSDAAAPILIAGLKDENVNVRLESAKAFQDNPIPSAADDVAAVLESSPEEVLRELLALSAGAMESKKMIEVLKKIESADEAQVSVNAQMALAKLGDSKAREAILSQLNDSTPRTRYDALEKLIYINDPRLARFAVKLLDDTAIARRIGTIKNPQYRRVCDQAVDTLVFLMRLPVRFRTSPEVIYSDEQISEVIDRAR